MGGGLQRDAQSAAVYFRGVLGIPVVAAHALTLAVTLSRVSVFGSPCVTVLCIAGYFFPLVCDQSEA